MRHLLLAVVSVGVWALGASGSAWAQYQYTQPVTTPYQRPVLSPYLNLLRPGLPSVNYYGIVRPEQQLYNSTNLLQQQIGINQQAIAGLQQTATAPVTTGHPISFLNYRRYFLNLGGQGVGGGLPQAGPGTAAASPQSYAAGRGARPGPSQPGARGF